MKPFMGVRAAVAATLFVLGCLTISAAGAGAALPSGARVVAPKPLIPHGAKQLGPVSGSATVSGAVVLKPRDEGALTRFISQVTNRHSALFHHYLAPGAFAARFGPAPASIAAVESQLRSDGLTVDGVDRDGLIVHFSAAASRVEHAFGTGLERYKLANGSIGQARTSPLRVPASIAKYVGSVVGLDNTLRLHSSSILRAPRSALGSYPAAKTVNFAHPAGSPTACGAAADTATEFGGLTDDQIANAYGVFGLYGANDFGAGQHVGIFELEPFSTSDLQTFDTCYFGATQAAAMVGRVHTIAVDGGQPAGPGEGEAALDIQNVSAFAPAANIDVYEAPNTTFGSIDMYAKMVNDDVDQVISTSWGLCEQALEEGAPGVQQAENLIFEQAAAQGQTVFASSGDNGSNDCNAFRTTSPVDPVLSVDDPSGQPYVVSTGGTTIDDATQSPVEHVWNDGAAFGSAGGGISESWAAPGWQLNPLLPGGVASQTNQDAVTAAQNFMGTGFCLSDTSGGTFESACREVPDVSAQADEFTGGITIFLDEFGGWLTIGGTSSAAPMWAAMLADVNESPQCVANGLSASATKGVGFANPLLYSVASDPTADQESFNDITTGNNDQYGFSQLFNATSGYDMASGLGTPELTQPGGGPGLAANLCDMAPSTTRPTVSDVSPDFGPTTPNTTVQITGTNFEDGQGNPQVSSVQVGNFTIPSFAVTVTSPTTISAELPPAADFTNPPGDPTDGAGRQQIVVTLDNGETSAPNPNSIFTYVDENGSSQILPAVTSVHAYAGPESGGNTVQIFGSGFTGATDVSFGGVSVGAGNFTVDNDWKITATVPAFDSLNTTCAQDGSSFDPSENAANDICQTQVVVTNANGSSQTSTILPLYEGAFAFNDHGVIPAPAGQEPAPAPTEYDYVPAPTITSISTDPNDPSSFASEEGGTLVTIDGSGFNLATLESVDFGDPTQESSQNFFNLVEVTGTEIQILAPPTADITADSTTVPVSIQTVAGLSGPTDATYAGIPTVSSVLATAGPTQGTNAGPDTGGTPIDIAGQGFDEVLGPILFADNFSGFSFGTQYNYAVNSDTDVTTTTVAQNPAVADVQLCTVTDCSSPTSQNGDSSDVFLLFPPGNPKIDSITPSSGPVTGGTNVTITGENLGCVTSISFGSRQAETFSNQTALLDCGSSTVVTVTAPAGAAVGTVPVTVHTVESDATGAAPASGSFTYNALPNETLTVSKAGTGSGSVTSSPAGIDCGATCSHPFTQGTTVTLTAAPASGSTFAGWSGGCSGTGSCAVTMNAATGVTATFNLIPKPKPKPCVVPNVKGKTLSRAKRALSAHFCRAGKIKHAFSGKVKKGRVISQKPKAHRRLAHNAKVNLVVSKGKKHK
jgi:hypothetical protein